MSLINPGKRGILTVIALMLIVGVPGIVAYADGSDDTYFSEVEDESVPDYVRISSSTFNADAIADGDYFILQIADTSTSGNVSFSSLTSVTSYTVIDGTANLSSVPDKISVAVADLDVTSVTVVFTLDGEAIDSWELEYSSTSDSWSYVPSTVEKAAVSSAAGFRVVLGVEESEAVSTFSLAVKLYESETVFTDDVVELIVMIGGIALLICGTFALSFIDVNTPGKAVSYAKRGIRSAGNKMRRGKK